MIDALVRKPEGTFSLCERNPQKEAVNLIVSAMREAGRLSMCTPTL